MVPRSSGMDQSVFVKTEDTEDDPADLPEEDSDEGWLEEEDGVEYYSDSGFRIEQVSEPRIVQRTLGELYAASQTKYMILDPEYQRDIVWDETRASTLIASIFQGYFIPPVIFNVVSKYELDASGGEKKLLRHYRTCIDGKQRLTSIQKFMDGKIGVLDSSHPPKRWYYRHPIVDGREQLSNHNIIPVSTRQFFASRMFCCYEYSNIGKAVEETMFQLVQRGVPLTPAEKLRALSTEWAKFGKRFEERYSKVLNLSNQGRASGFRTVVTIFAQVLEVMQPGGARRGVRGAGVRKPGLQASAQALGKFLRDDDSLNATVEGKMKQVFEKYQHLVNLSSIPSSESRRDYEIMRDSAFDPAPSYLQDPEVNHVKTFSPLELLSTAILLVWHMDSRTDELLLEDIKDMRYYLRIHQKDLRLNGSCWATAWSYIDKELIRRRGLNDKRDVDNSNAESISNGHALDGTPDRTLTSIPDRTDALRNLNGKRSATINGNTNLGSQEHEPKRMKA